MEYGSNRVEANVVMPMAEGASGESGYQVTGYYVNWDVNGITGKNWTDVIGLVNSPFAGWTEKTIQEHIDKVGNFNDLFSDWGSTHGPSEENDFVQAAVAIYGFTDKGGCIGDRLY